MTVLCLGPRWEGVIQILRSAGDQVRCTEEKVRAGHPELDGVDVIVSYGSW